MNIFKITFGVLVLWLILIVAMWINPTPEYTTGIPHPEGFPGMLHSGTAQKTMAHSKWFAFGFGILILMTFTLSLLIGVRRGGKIGPIKKWILIIMAGYALIYVGMVVSWWGYTGDASTTYFMGWPAPTAFMIYGIWFFPMAFAVLCISKFEEWFLKPDDLEKFRSILAEGKNN